MNDLTIIYLALLKMMKFFWLAFVVFLSGIVYIYIDERHKKRPSKFGKVN